MMRGPVTTAMAVRNTKGEIVIEKFPTEAKQRSKFLKLPFVRGVFAYIDSMVQGSKCLMRSAEISGLEEAEEELRREKEAKKAEKAAKKAAKKRVQVAENADTPLEEVVEKINEDTEATVAEKVEGDFAEIHTEPISDKAETQSDDKSEKKKEGTTIMGVMMPVITVISFVIAILLFFVLPTYLFTWAQGPFPFLKNDNEIIQSLIKSLFEGSFKVVILVGYMGVMLLMKDIRRTFQFHGAEHKTIFCYEAGLELTVENVRKQKRFHPRCGTSFLILMVLVSVFVSFCIDPVFLLIRGEVPPTLIRAAIRIALIPLIVGLGYELIKIAGKHDNIITKIISAPGVWLQHITVLEPDDSMIECAIAAMNEVVPSDESDNW